MNLNSLLKSISVKVQEKKHADALAICKSAESSMEVATSFLFWHAAGQCAIVGVDWKLAEKYLSKACTCDAQPIQMQKNYKVIDDLLHVLHTFHFVLIGLYLYSF